MAQIGGSNIRGFENSHAYSALSIPPSRTEAVEAFNFRGNLGHGKVERQAVVGECHFDAVGANLCTKILEG